MSSREENLGCERSVDAAPYVLGALADADSYREHLGECASCRAEVAELQLVVDTLPRASRRSAPRRPCAKACSPRSARRPSCSRRRAAAARSREPAPRGGGRCACRSRAGLAIARDRRRCAVAITVGLRSVTQERVSTGAGSREHPRRARVPAPERQSRRTRCLGHAATAGRRHLRGVAGSQRASPQPTDALFGVTSSGSGSVNVPGNLHGVHEVMVTREPQGGTLTPDDRTAAARRP